MDRKTLVNLIRNGMVEHPQRKTHLWVIRCFEISPREDRKVEINEYEVCEVSSDGDEVSAGNEMGIFKTVAQGIRGMIHVGRTVVGLDDGQVTEHLPDFTEPKRTRSTKVKQSKKVPSASVTV